MDKMCSFIIVSRLGCFFLFIQKFAKKAQWSFSLKRKNGLENTIQFHRKCFQLASRIKANSFARMFAGEVANRASLLLGTG